MCDRGAILDYSLQKTKLTARAGGDEIILVGLGLVRHVHIVWRELERSDSRTSIVEISRFVRTSEAELPQKSELNVQACRWCTR